MRLTFADRDAVRVAARGSARVHNSRPRHFQVPMRDLWICYAGESGQSFALGYQVLR